MAEAEVVTEDEMDYLKGWTVQSETSPIPPPPVAPQKFVEGQLPAELPAEDYVPEDLITDDPEELDPDDRVLAGAPAYEPDPPADFGDPPDDAASTAMAGPDPAHGVVVPAEEAPAEEEAAVTDEGIPPDTWTKQEIQDWADERGIEGVDMDTQTKAEMIAAIEAAG